MLYLRCLSLCFGLFVVFDSIAKESNQQHPTPFIQFQEQLDSLISDYVPGAVLLVETPDQTFVGSAGYSDLENKIKMTADAVMPNGSAGKKLTALLAVMLHVEGKLDLDSSIKHYLPEEYLSRIKFSKRMNLRMLLNHSSGIFEYNDTPDYGFYWAQFSSPDKFKGDEYLLKFALDKEPEFEPGTRYLYSNTGYALTGIILKKLLGHHPAVAIREKILVPLKMSNSYSKAIEPHIPDFIPGYFFNDVEEHFPLPFGKISNMKAHMASIATSDAPMVSDVTDLAKLLRAIVKNNSVVSSKVREQMIGDKNLIPAWGAKFYRSSDLYYGLGIFVEEIHGKRFYHHGGTEFGYFTQNIYIADGDISITAFANCGVNDHCEEEFQNFSFEVLDGFLKIRN